MGVLGDGKAAPAACRDPRRWLRGVLVLALAIAVVLGEGELAGLLRAVGVVPGSYRVASGSSQIEVQTDASTDGGSGVSDGGSDASPDADPGSDVGLDVDPQEAFPFARGDDEGLGLPSGGGGDAQVDPADPGSTPTQAELAELMDAYLDQNFPWTGVPGVAVAVVSARGTLYERTLGDCQDAGSTFVIGSLSKSFTAVAVMQLVETGQVDLDDPIGCYVADAGLPDSVTVRSLLNQTSGFGYYDSPADAWPGASAGSFSYSNANYDLLGRLVEAVSGMSYGDYLGERVFAPLGMYDASAYGSDDARAGEAAQGSVPGHRNWFGLNLADGYLHQDGDHAWGGPSSGYVRASLSDMESYLRMYLRSGSGVLNPSSVRALALSRVPDPYGDTYYGMGWTTFGWDGGELVMSHDGQVENYVARMMVLPSRGIALVVLGDASDYFGGNEAFWQMADGVTSIAVGGGGVEVDGGERLLLHAEYDGLYLVMVGCALASLLRVRRWARRLEAARGKGRTRDFLAWGLVAYGLLPLSLLWVPRLYGAPWRDFATFVPDASAVILVTVALLLASGATRLSLALRSRT